MQRLFVPGLGTGAVRPCREAWRSRTTQVAEGEEHDGLTQAVLAHWGVPQLLPLRVVCLVARTHGATAAAAILRPVVDTEAELEGSSGRAAGWTYWP